MIYTIADDGRVTDATGKVLGAVYDEKEGVWCIDIAGTNLGKTGFKTQEEAAQALVDYWRGE